MPHPQDILTTAFAQQGAGRVAECEKTLRSGLRQWPNDAGINFALASLLFTHNRPKEGVVFAQRAADLEGKRQPPDPRPLVLLAKCLLRSNKFAQCDAAAKKVLSFAPDDADALNTLANSLLAQQRSDEAAPLLEKALAIEPDSVTVAVTYAAVLTDLAQAEKAFEIMSEAARKEPTNIPVVVGCATGSLYCSGVSSEEKLRMAKAAGALVKGTAQRVGLAKHLIADFSAERQLRVGIVSNDFRQHSCAYFLSGLLGHVTQKRHGISIVCFSLTDNPDRVTTQLRERVIENDGEWHDVHELQSVQLAEKIVKEKIDIVLDLGGWSAGSGIEAMALKPAPLIGTYLGYAGTTGLDAIDFRIVDRVTDPLPGEANVSGSGSFDPQQWHTERLVRLDRCFICYDAAKAPAKPRSPRAADSQSPITFGSFNTPAKISSQCLDLWAGVLKRVTGSRLLLKGVGLGGTQSPAYLRREFEKRGVAAERIVCRGRASSVAEHLSHYEEVDISLDPYPYHGTTTTCEALAMGVPVISLAGREHVSRVGASLLTSCGAKELVANSAEEFAEIASRLASDGRSLHELHATLRERFLKSQICDEAGFADAIGRAIRGEWIAFCERKSRGGKL
ncbi:MAG: tetratricopeptide repeat protein [Phycisphaerales bacterium]